MRLRFPGVDKRIRLRGVDRVAPDLWLRSFEHAGRLRVGAVTALSRW